MVNQHLGHGAHYWCKSCFVYVAHSATAAANKLRAITQKDRGGTSNNTGTAEVTTTTASGSTIATNAIADTTTTTAFPAIVTKSTQKPKKSKRKAASKAIPDTSTVTTKAATKDKEGCQ
jgi:hypothetical protein